MITPDAIRAELPPGGLFRAGGIPWRVSPSPLPLPGKLVRQLRGLGHILARFQDASHSLYHRSLAGEEAPWLAPILDAGKPDWLVRAQHSPSLRKDAPRIIRPDLLWCEEGLSLVELDSVPGGMGITLFLSRLYAREGFPVLGGSEGMAEGFRAAYPEGSPLAVSDESADYRPEMAYFSHALGEDYPLLRAEELTGQERGTLYRFFELFDTDALPAARPLIEASARGELSLSPPALPHLEEKIWLALLHCPGLRPYWEQHLRASHLERLQQLIPHGWVVDPTPLPPQACLPWLNLHRWSEVERLSQKERRLVLKISGFDPRAWGSRGVVIGHDVSSEEWKQALRQALEDYPNRLWLLQDFHEARLIEHPFYTEDGRLEAMPGRVRLCPYYFRLPDGRTELGGCLATITPADKKKIHGMSNAILAPCIPA